MEQTSSFMFLLWVFHRDNFEKKKEKTYGNRDDVRLLMEMEEKERRGRKKEK